MKKGFLSVVIVVLAISTSNAQITKGHVQYSIEMTSDNPEMEMAINMMQGSTMDIYFEDNNSRQEMKMGTFMTNTTIYNGEENQSLMLMSGMMGKKAIILTSEDLEADTEEGDDVDFEVELVDETKEILGYTCKKAIIISEDDNELIYWYTEEIAPAERGEKSNDIDLPGMPLEFQTSQGEMMMTMTATVFNKKFKAEKGWFSTEIPEGYEEMTMEELKAMGGGQ